MLNSWINLDGTKKSV